MKYLHLIWHSYDGQLFTLNPIVTPANPRKKAVFASCVFARNSFLFFSQKNFYICIKHKWSKIISKVFWLLNTLSTSFGMSKCFAYIFILKFLCFNRRMSGGVKSFYEIVGSVFLWLFTFFWRSLTTCRFSTLQNVYEFFLVSDFFSLDAKYHSVGIAMKFQYHSSKYSTLMCNPSVEPESRSSDH